jgi:hypothetical protein
MEKSNLSKFVKNCRGDLSYRNFAKKINTLFTYSYLKYIEDDMRCPDEDKWITFAKIFDLDEIKAKDMLNEQRIHVGYNLKVKKLYKEMIKQGSQRNEDDNNENSE